MERLQRIMAPDVLDGKMDGLKRKLQHLVSKKEDIKEELKNEVESSSRKRIRKVVENWIKTVQHTTAKVEELEKQVSKSRFLNRLLIETKVDSLTSEVTDLIGQSKFERGLTLETPAEQDVALLTKRLIGETFAKNKRKILDYLMEGTESIVGVYGMGGIGKTTLITHIYNELRDQRGVRVSWVTVSQNFSIHKLQQDIAKTVGCLQDISREDDVRIRAARLADALGRKEKLILILDDVWENISLIDVGICIGQNVWKLILTTRSATVCRMLNCKSPVKVEPLSEVEAWTLFAETLDNGALLSDHRINVIAKSLVRECDGLPLGIVVMAGSMRGVDDIHEWSNALDEIREAKYRSGDMEFYDRVFLVLRYSYDKLKDPKVKECLLYCSLFPEDKLIPRYELIEYLIDEKLIEGTNNRQSALEKGHTILNQLANICLLEAQNSFFKDKIVKMHDLVRDMAIKIASDSSHPFLVQSRMRLKDLPNDENWSEDLSRVSLMDNEISSIPSNFSPKCPRLATLLLRGNGTLRVIPNKFFMHMKMLTVLDLSWTAIESVPTSIANLESLNTLLLRSCKCLKNMPSLENLTALRRLDLSSTAIKEVPKGMEKLINLRYLNFEECCNLKMIPDGILPQLSKMEWFCSRPSLKLREEEIGSWRKIETFGGAFMNLDNLNTCVTLWEEKGPSNYDIVVGYDYCEEDDGHDFMNIETKKRVFVFGNEDKGDKFGLLSSIETLKLKRCNGLCSLSHIAPLKKRNITSSYSSVLPSSTFSSLKYLEIINCQKLERLFTPAMLPALQCLEEIVVLHCYELVEIMGERIREDEDQHVEATTTIFLSTFPNLKILILLDLPKLKSICDSSIRLSHSLLAIEISDCQELKRITLLWDEPQSPTFSDRVINVEKDWWDSVEWKHPPTKAILQPFVTLCE